MPPSMERKVGANSGNSPPSRNLPNFTSEVHSRKFLSALKTIEGCELPVMANEIISAAEQSRESSYPKANKVEWNTKGDKSNLIAESPKIFYMFRSSGDFLNSTPYINAFDWSKEGWIKLLQHSYIYLYIYALHYATEDTSPGSTTRRWLLVYIYPFVVQ